MNILVIGDIMLDINYNSEIKRKAPEANIPIHNITNIEYILGGAANVAYNLNNLGACVELISVTGDDTYSKIVKDILYGKDIKYKFFVDQNRPTTNKNRIFNGCDLSVRYDIESTDDIVSELAENILFYVNNKKNINAIVISDYDKGVITEYLCQQIISWANINNIFTFVDPKLKNYNKYKECFLFKPNEVEAEKITGSKNIEEILHVLKTQIQCKNVLLTRGNEGMILNNISNKIEHNEIINLVDVTGAGDVVLSVLVYEYLKTSDLLLSAKIANYVAGKSVGVIGNYLACNCDIEDYYNICEKSENTIIKSKIIFDYETEKLENISKNKNKNKNIVFTNGCFDILHSAHIKLLQFSRKQGDLLVVGLNSDSSIQTLKGPSRPINNVLERSHILELFDFVDYVIIFDELTPLNIIKSIRPNTIVKGSDYKANDVVGKEYVDSVILFNYIDGKSSTSVINKIKGNMLV
jgi:D-beta-D-heptose 7-phosphate kinase / D-beta-D-heptose 1-phosphate adenosyltransferase